MNLDRITLAAEVVIEAMAAEATKDFNALAEHLRRSLGQRYRQDRRVRDEHG